MVLHTSINEEDCEILLDYCQENHISVSALIRTLVADFLDTSDRNHIDYITNEAKKIKQGRPRQDY